MTNFYSLFLIIGSLLSCIFSITSKNPVISVIFLILTFVQTALFLILKGFIFIGLSYIIIYVGAIAVIFLFVVMMINIRLTDILETETQYTKNLPLAIIIGYLFLLILTAFFEFNLFSDVLVSVKSLKGVEASSNLPFDHADYWSYIGQFDFLADSLLNSNNLLLDSKIIEISQLKNLGFSLYTYYAVLLIVLGFVLLLSMYSAIIISNNSDKVNPEN